MNQRPRSIAVLGAGSWGTALAILLARNGMRVVLWGHERAHMERLIAEGANPDFLPDIPFPEGVFPTWDIEQALSDQAQVLIVVPSHAFRQVLQQMAPLAGADTRILWATKGLEMSTGRLMHEVFEEVMGPRRAYGVLSGPTFAAEVARGLPTAITVASADEPFAGDIAASLHNETFRAYTSTDVVGVQIGGAAKNVLAIAAGISDGMGFGANARAALITRGIAEILRLGVGMGGQQETFLGLAGVGDLVLTCTDNQSRNRRMGLALAAGKTQAEAQEEIKQVVEGVQTARVVVRLAQQHRVEMPITEQVYRVLYENVAPRDAVHQLFARQQKPEF